MPQTEESFNFSSPQNMKFFRLYRKERALWDPSHEFFRVRTQRKKAMERIVEKMDIQGLQFKHIRLKLRSYRDMYTREMKKYTRDSDSDHRMPWWLKELSFLKDAKNKEESAPIKTNAAGESEQSDSCDGSEISFEMKIEKEMPVDFEFISNESPHSPPQSPHELSNTLDTNMFEPSTSTDNIASTTAESFKDVLSAMNRTQAEMLSVLNKEKEVINKEDHYDTFAKYIASLLRNLPKAKAFALQPKIVTMITSEHMKVSKDE